MIGARLDLAAQRPERRPRLLAEAVAEGKRLGIIGLGNIGKKVTLIYPDYAFGHDLQRAAKQFMERYG